MTAEVAVMNRSAVALAADSAVTLSGSDADASVDKIFQNENKLFELSKTHPVGIMLYNSTSFFDVPWEVIIKDFRNEVGHSPCNTIGEWGEKFLGYLSIHPKFLPDASAQSDFISALFKTEFYNVLNSWSNDVRNLVFQRQTSKVKDKYIEVLLRSINDRIKIYSHAPYFEGYDSAVGLSKLARYKAEFDAAKSEIFKMPLTSAHDDAIKTLAVEVLVRARPQWFTTGLVFAGFGSSELFPALRCLELGGVVDGQVRYFYQRKVDIDRSSTTAEIIPFAQRDVVDTLLFGRAGRYERQVSEHFSDAMRQMGNQLVEQLVKSAPQKKAFRRHVDAAVNGVMTHFRAQHSRNLRDAFANDTLDIVRHMPKPDLAAFAESLVTVSSMKRKVTVGPETVGGPVDVAVISRHEGFVWVKRKHYFDSALNPRYMWRSFAQHSS